MVSFANAGKTAANTKFRIIMSALDTENMQQTNRGIIIFGRNISAAAIW